MRHSYTPGTSHPDYISTIGMASIDEVAKDYAAFQSKVNSGKYDEARELLNPLKIVVTKLSAAHSFFRGPLNDDNVKAFLLCSKSFFSTTLSVILFLERIISKSACFTQGVFWRLLLS